MHALQPYPVITVNNRSRQPGIAGHNRLLYCAHTRVLTRFLLLSGCGRLLGFLPCLHCVLDLFAIDLSVLQELTRPLRSNSLWIYWGITYLLA